MRRGLLILSRMEVMVKTLQYLETFRKYIEISLNMPRNTLNYVCDMDPSYSKITTYVFLCSFCIVHLLVCVLMFICLYEYLFVCLLFICLYEYLLVCVLFICLYEYCIFSCILIVY